MGVGVFTENLNLSMYIRVGIYVANMSLCRFCRATVKVTCERVLWLINDRILDKPFSLFIFLCLFVCLFCVLNRRIETPSVSL